MEHKNFQRLLTDLKEFLQRFSILLSHISTQIILIVGITVVLVLSCTVMFFYHSTVQTIRSNTIQSNEVILNQLNNGFEEYMKELLNFTLNVRMDSRMISIMEAREIDYTDQKAVDNYLKAMFYSRHDLCDISVHLLLSDTKIGFSRNSKKINTQNESDIEQELWFQIAASRPDFSYVVPLTDSFQQLTDLTVKTPFLRVYRIIINAYTKAPIAAVEITCDMSSLEPIMENLKQQPSSLICLTDQNGSSYFTGSYNLEAADFPNSNDYLGFLEHGGSIFLDQEPFLVVSQNSKSGTWLLTKFISVDTLTAQYIQNKNISLIVLATATLITLSAIAFLVHLLTRSLKQLARQMQQAGKGDLKTTLAETGSYETRLLTHRYNSMIAEIDDLIKKNYVMELNEKAAKIQALESQINPHFLYNSLQVISSRTIMSGDREVYLMIEALAGNLRYAFKESVLVSVDLEVQYISNYLLLLQARFEDRLNTHICTSPSAGSFLIPKISIFTMIENSVIHGLEASMDKFFIDVSIDRKGQQLMISVSDNGPGIQQAELEEINQWLNHETTLAIHGEHMGLRNLNARLKLYFGSQAELKVTSRPGVKTTTTMTLIIS